LIRPGSRDVSSAVTKRPRAATVATATQSTTTTTAKQKATASKPTLLSPSQKKANHIQSEQKRRANIRRGYDALCEAVPALREAILQEEQEQAEKERDRKGKGRAGGNARNGSGSGTTNARRGSKSDLNEDITGANETRAGPRSESVVLQKGECVAHAITCYSGDVTLVFFFLFDVGYRIQKPLNTFKN
jgi:hypothetical protein